MKKPKPRKKKAPKMSECTVIGGQWAVLNFKIPLGVYFDHEIEQMTNWCKDHLEPRSWKCTGGWPGAMHFANEADMTMFALRWISK